MIRKVLVLTTVFLIAAISINVASASNPALPGCYVDAPTAVDEGAVFTATVTCNTLSAAFGFEIGTSLTGDATTAAATYTPGTFTTAASGGVIEGSNTLDLYAVTRQGLETATGDFTLGSYDITADIGLTADGSTTVNFDSLKLSTLFGVPIPGMLQTNPEAVITINNIDLALLSGDITITSDGGAGITALTGIDMTLDGVDYSMASVAANSHNFTVTGNPKYTDLDVDVTADMESHLACVETYSLVDGANAAASAVGTITLLAGDAVTVSDADINIQDATAVGAQFGSNSPTGEVDINGDGTVDIYDLVHVGRNYGAAQGTCS